MNAEILEKLSVITEEEQAILNGEPGIDRRLYFQEGKMSEQNRVDASLLLGKGKLIDIRPHTRFVHFPEHTHNFVEIVYMCHGTTTHIIDHHEVVLREGGLLMMNQHARQEILPAGREDIAVNFIILPPFFDSILREMDSSSTAISEFLVSCLTGQNRGSNYLAFDTAGVLPVRNLCENLIWIMLNDPVNRQTLSQKTMSLLFMNLTGCMDRIPMRSASYEQDLMLKLLGYIDGEYKDASLSEFAARCGISIYSLGRIIRRQTAKTFTDLVEEKRMRQASWLLQNTRISVEDISYTVGYENTSYFYRLFRKVYGMSPREFRKEQQAEQNASHAGTGR